jgi:hypothetical protein
MALLRSTVNPQHYLKVLDNCGIFAHPRQVTKNPDIVDENGNATPQPDTIIPASVDFVIGYRVFKSQAERVQSETDEMIWFKDHSITYHALPELPTGWQAKNPAETDAEKIKTLAYMALQADPAFADWQTDEV